jgi:hypothetical protein
MAHAYGHQISAELLMAHAYSHQISAELFCVFNIFSATSRTFSEGRLHAQLKDAPCRDMKETFDAEL